MIWNIYKIIYLYLKNKYLECCCDCLVIVPTCLELFSGCDGCSDAPNRNHLEIQTDQPINQSKF